MVLACRWQRRRDPFGIAVGTKLDKLVVVRKLTPFDYIVNPAEVGIAILQWLWSQ